MKKTFYRFKTIGEIEKCAKKTGWFENVGEIWFHLHRGPYIYTTKMFEIVKKDGIYSEIRNIISGKKHKVYSFTLKKIV